MFALGAIVSLCYVPGVTGAFVATQWPMLSILLPCIALTRKGSWTVFHWIGVLFIAYAAGHLYSVPIFDDGVWGVWVLCIMALSFWLGSTLKDLRELYKGLAIGAGVSSVIAIFQVFGYQIVPRVSEHPAGLYINGVVQGMIMACLMVALVSERMWLWTLPLMPGLVLSGSRGAGLALAVGLLSVYVRRAWIFGLIGAAGLALLLSVKPQSSDELRVLIWNDALHYLTPWGWGPGSFFSWMVPYRETLIYPEYAHNDAIQLIFEYGIFAALPLSIFIFALSRTRAREWPVMVAFATASCYSMPLYAPVTSFLACVVAGRIVHGWHLHGRGVHSRGFRVISWRRRRRTDGGEHVPVLAGHQAEGN